MIDSLDCDKRMTDVEKLSGDESLSDVKDWYKRMHIKINSARPGAGIILEWAVHNPSITSLVKPSNNKMVTLLWHIASTQSCTL